VKRPSSRKNPELCKGLHWQPHVPVITLRMLRVKKGCGWSILPWNFAPDPYWSCWHVLICEGCGKNFGRIPVAQCPSYHAITPGERELLDTIVSDYQTWASRGKRKIRGIITGPQGYRKKRP
jgi:hypothetical protein